MKYLKIVESLQTSRSLYGAEFINYRSYKQVWYYERFSEHTIHQTTTISEKPAIMSHGFFLEANHLIGKEVLEGESDKLLKIS